MEKVTFGLSVAGLGMVVVFIGLLILIGFISILALFSRERKKPAAAPVKKAAPVMAPPAPTVASAGVPAEVVAAITAAIAAVWEGETGFVVRRVRRISNAPAWKRAGREEQTYSRF